MKSLRILGNWAIGIFVGIVLVSAIAAISDLTFIFYVGNLSSVSIDAAKVEAIETRQIVIGGIQVVLNIFCMIIFLIWFYRAHKNLSAGGLDGLRYTSKWTIIGFMVPLLNFVRPYQVMKEVWLGSVLLTRDREDELIEVDAPTALVGWWWAFFLITWLLGNGYGRMIDRAETPVEIVTASWVLFASDFMDIPAAAAALLIVERITNLQEQSRKHPPVDDDQATN